MHKEQSRIEFRLTDMSRFVPITNGKGLVDQETKGFGSGQEIAILLIPYVGTRCC
jgi:hypothetical protein